MMPKRRNTRYVESDALYAEACGADLSPTNEGCPCKGHHLI